MHNIKQYHLEQKNNEIEDEKHTVIMSNFEQ